MTVRYLVILSPLLLGGCYGLSGHDEVDRYFQRSDTITMSADDAKQVNAVTQTINPWPRNVGDRRIAYDARRVDTAVTRYGDTTRPVDQLPDIGKPGLAMGQRPPTTQNINVNGLGAGSTSGVAAQSLAGDGLDAEFAEKATPCELASIEDCGEILERAVGEIGLVQVLSDVFRRNQPGQAGGNGTSVRLSGSLSLRVVCQAALSSLTERGRRAPQLG